MIYLPIFNFWGYIFSKYQQFITIWLYRLELMKDQTLLIKVLKLMIHTRSPRILQNYSPSQCTNFCLRMYHYKQVARLRLFIFGGTIWTFSALYSFSFMFGFCLTEFFQLKIFNEAVKAHLIRLHYYGLSNGECYENIMYSIIQWTYHMLHDPNEYDILIMREYMILLIILTRITRF